MPNKFIIDYILSSGGVTQEYQLLKFIEKEHPIFFETLGQSPSLFKKHFYLFHQLYCLRDYLLAKNKILSISTLEIKISESLLSSTKLSEHDGLADFYLNIDHLSLPDDEITKMLNDFWEKYLAIDKKRESLVILGLENESYLDLNRVKNRYKELAMLHHPDKGGSKKKFIQIKYAMENLKHLFD